MNMFFRGLTVLALAASLALPVFSSEPSIRPISEGRQRAEDYPGTLAQAGRFLTQATFGASIEEMQRLRLMGYSAWIDEQVALPASVHRPLVKSLVDANVNPDVDNPSLRVAAWWDRALNAPDQLRQRVAFALSEILVISDDNDLLSGQVLGLAEYYDYLVRGAFGNFRSILENVSKSPAMGIYLSHLQNQRADPENNVRPDENYAREVLQLFSIGLWHLNQDGSRRLDGQGNPIPTYDQSVIEEFARVFTGWTFADAPYWDYYSWEDLFWRPMEPYNELGEYEREGGYHDRDAKLLLAYPVNGQEPSAWPRKQIPALAEGEDAQTDMTRAMNNIFNHPNVGPFISKQLIQRLVTSNPSPEYVGRVAAQFNNNGNGVRGDMQAVVRAILTDQEARFGHVRQPETFGKLREPLLRLTQFWRVLDARPIDDQQAPAFYASYWFYTDWWFKQTPLRSPSVFNFFTPGYRPSGEIAEAGLVAPEFQITDETFINMTANYFFYQLLVGFPGAEYATDESMLLNLDDELALASDPAALVEHLNLLFLSGGMSEGTKTELIAALESIPLDFWVDNLQHPPGMGRTLLAIYMVVTMPEYVIQR